MQRLPVPFLTCFRQNALFCSLLIMGRSNKMLLKMGVGKVLRTDVRLLLSLTVFLLEENISPFHNLGVSQNSRFELCPPPPTWLCMLTLIHGNAVWNGNGGKQQGLFGGWGSVKYFVVVRNHHELIRVHVYNSEKQEEPKKKSTNIHTFGKISPWLFCARVCSVLTQ